MLSDRARIILFWFTIAMMVLVAVVAAMTILRACGGPASKEPPPAISPPEISLCPGEKQQFAVGEEAQVTWETTGGAIDTNGLFTAGDTPGDYSVTAKRTDSGQAATAIVHITACTPTPTRTPLPSPTVPVTPTATSTPESEATSPAAPSPEGGGGRDAQDDVVSYEGGEAVDALPGVDIRDASAQPNLNLALQPEDVPEGLADLAGEGDVLLWVSLYEPIPDPPQAYTNWLFSLDVDGDAETGRLAGSAQINPDLGDEAAIGLSYNPANGAYEPYVLVWDTEQEDWVAGPDVRYQIDETRTLVGLALSLDALTEDIASASGVTLAADAVKGRSAAETYTADGTRIIDFYPNRPE